MAPARGTSTLLPEEVAKVPQELWPKAWEGVARTA
jgi:hypothetical protein